MADTTELEVVEQTPSESSGSRSPTLSLSTSEEASKTAPSSSTSENMTVGNEVAEVYARPKPLSRRSIAKARAVTPSAPLAHAACAMLPSSVVARIMSFYGLADEYMTVPKSYRRIGLHRDREYAEHTWSILRFRTTMNELRKISNTWREAVESHAAWLYVWQLLADRTDVPRRKGAVVEPRTFYLVTEIEIRKRCPACLINDGPGDANEDVFPIDLPMVRDIYLCEEHNVDLPVEDDEEVSCCQVCLGGSALGDSGGIVQNDDFEVFPDASSTCASCRDEALARELRRTRSACGNMNTLGKAYNESRARRHFVEHGIGSLADAYWQILEDLWLLTCTEYDRLRSEHVIRTRRNMQKARKNKAVAARDLDFSDDEQNQDDDDYYGRFEPSDIDQNEDRKLRLYAIDRLCFSLLWKGHWIFPQEQYNCYGEMSAIPYARLGIEPPPSALTGNSRNAALIPAIHLPLLPPTSQLLSDYESRWGLCLKDFLENAFSNLTVHILGVATPEERFHAGNDWDGIELLHKIREPVCWTRADPDDPAKTICAMPTFPPHFAVVGQKALNHIRRIWFGISAPLRECGCSICSRSKRKRDDEDDTTSGRQSPQQRTRRHSQSDTQTTA